MHYINLKEVPRDLLIATYNEVFPIVFGSDDFDNGMAVRAFIQVLDPLGEQKIKENLDKWQERYNREFKKILNENEDLRTCEKTRILLAECNNRARKYFDYKQKLLKAHVNFYINIKVNLAEYNKQSAITLNRGRSGTVVAVGGFVSIAENVPTDARPLVKFVYNDLKDSNKLNEILDKVQEISRQKNIENLEEFNFED